MAKNCDDSVQDAALNEIKDNATHICLCSSEPSDYTSAYATVMLARTTVSSGDFTIAAGDVSGRKMTVAAKSAFSITNNGTLTHVALVDQNNTLLLLVTTATSQSLYAGNTVSTPAFIISIPDPV